MQASAEEKGWKTCFNPLLCYWWDTGQHTPHFPPPEPWQLLSYHPQLSWGSAWQLLENPEEDCTGFLLGSTQTSEWREKAATHWHKPAAFHQVMVLGGCHDRAPASQVPAWEITPWATNTSTSSPSWFPHGLKGLCLTLAGTSTAPAQLGIHWHLLDFFTWLGIIRTAQSAVASIIHHNHISVLWKAPDPGCFSNG